MNNIPFNQRFGFVQSKPIDNDFPDSARIALAHLIVDIANKGYVDEEKLLSELMRTGRLIYQDLEPDFKTKFFNKILILLKKIEWWMVYIFCERVYEHTLEPVFGDAEGEYTEVVNIKDIQRYFTNELNNIINEDNLAFHFVDGRFQRRGRAQTQYNIQRVGTVLKDQMFSNVREHFNKARKFFDQRPDPDLENCIKEAICALEACVETITKKQASKDFTKLLRNLTGNEQGKIPAPIAEGIIKIYGYRGSGTGVSHAALEGTRVSEIEAELVLSVVASYITYLIDLFTFSEDDVPF